MSDNPSRSFEQLATDTVYAAVGFAVLGFQKAQVRRRELTEALAERRVDVGGQVKAAGQNLRPPIEAALPHLEALRPQIEALRPQAEAVGTQLRSAAVALRPQLESLGAGVADLLKSVDEHTGPVRHDLEGRVAEIEAHLPPPARAAFDQLRARAVAQEELLHWVVGLLSPAAGERDAGERDAGERDAGERDAGEEEPPPSEENPRR